MATRDELAVIKAARTGIASAQLALGNRYFFGSSKLPQSSHTAFYWLERAARQGLADAWMMIGRHVSYEVVSATAHPYDAAPWYEKAFDAGELKAGGVFARLVLEHPLKFCDRTRSKALDALRLLADSEDHDAQWLLVQYDRAPTHPPQEHGLADAGPVAPAAPAEQDWVCRAAQAGIEGAQYSMLERAWARSDHDAYRARATPLSGKLLQRHHAVLNRRGTDLSMAPPITLEQHECRLLLRLSQLLLSTGDAQFDAVQKLLELCALGGEPEAQLELGLLHARMDRQGERRFPRQGLANYIRALPWLFRAAHQGHACAWYALSRVYAKSEFSQRDLPTARQCLQRAAEMGLTDAQFDYAQASWRNRRDARGDVTALYWWKAAASQGHAAAGQAIRQFSACPKTPTWAHCAVASLTGKLRRAHPFLCTRLDLAAAFGLTRPEALLIDVVGGDHGHCLEVDIRAQHARSKRRLILIEREEQRAVLTVAGRLFGDVDRGRHGPEGNYRQRQYKLKSLLAACNRCQDTVSNTSHLAPL